jgi:hypothetical protein
LLILAHTGVNATHVIVWSNLWPNSVHPNTIAKLQFILVIINGS